MTQPPNLARARLATYLIFFACGVVLAAWVSRIPAIKAKLGLDVGELGLVLFSMPVGLIISMPITGWAISRWGSHRAVTLAALACSASLPLAGLATNAWELALALFVLGFTNAAMDISMNAQAVEVEKQFHRPIMSSFHALFSLGGLFGAAAGAAAAAAGLAPLPFFTLTAVVLLTICVWAVRNVLHTPSQASGPRFAWPRGPLVGLGIVLFCTGLGEGAIADWSAVFMRQEIGTSEALAALGFSAFSIAMVVGRLSGDWLTHHFGPVTLARSGGTLATLGLVIILLSSSPVLALLGFILVGLGYCTLFPLVFSAAGRTPGVHPGVALASVATLGYLGFLVGPPLIGLVAQATSLRTSFALVAVLAGVIVVLAGLMQPKKG